uniref:Coiled-coil domain containing 146 n=1 Tax=Nothobranchius kuhntae TaxID=321403 RepID=A0A1A8KGC6_NOTKU
MQHAITVSKDRSLTKARMEVSNCSKTRDKLRNDISEVAWMQHQLSQQSKDNEQELTQLQQMIKLQRGVLLEVNTRLDKATQRQTFLRIQLLEQDEVLVNYREQLNNLEAAVAKGNMALETLEKDMRELQELKGKDPSEAELVHKMEQLEVNLAKCERQLLEKDLLVKQMDRCQRRLEQGLLPWPEMEEELRRMVQDKKRRQKDKEEKQRILEANGWNQMPNGKYTTAEARPDSYIPQNDPLGLPRPYGALAPCKPTKTRGQHETHP